MKQPEPAISAEVMFKAFSDRTRLRILNLLQPGELCVCDLVRIIKAPQPKISRHLAYLRKAGLVRSRKEGLWMHYKLSPAKTAFHRKLLECVSCCFSDLPELIGDIRQREAGCDIARRCCS